MVCWYVGVIVVTEDDSSEEVIEKLRNGDILQENGFDIYKLPGTLEEKKTQIKEEKSIDGISTPKAKSRRKSQDRDGVLAN